MSIITVTKENIASEIINSKETVLLDFWAPWCGPCRMIAPAIEQIANEVSNIKVGKINIDEEQELAIKFGIMSIPTLAVIKNGEVVKKSIGVKPKSVILEMIQ